MCEPHAEPIARRPGEPIASVARRITANNVVPFTLAWTVAAVVGDYLTSADVRFTLVYLFPVVLGTWFRSRRWGTFLCSVAALGSLVSELTTSEPLTAVIIAWNTAGVLAMMLVVVWALDRLRGFVRAEERERHLAVEQLRHSERLAVIGRLAAGVAHELGTPLNVIAGHAELLAEQDVAPERIPTSTKAIREQVVRMTSTIRQLLDFGRHDRSERLRIDLNVLTAATARMVETLVSKGGCALELALAPTPVEVQANPRQIEQVITNLVVNAVQAAPRSGVVRIGTAIADGAGVDGTTSRYGCVTVADDGGGIAEADLAKVFDPFFTTKDVGVGTGLGLSVSYGIVKDHDGVIDVESALGRGSRFVVRLPLAGS